MASVRSPATSAQSSLDAHRLLTGTGTAFMLVSSLDAAKILEAEDFRAALGDSGYHLAAVIVNRAHPEWFRADQNEIAAGLRKADVPELEELHAAMLRHYTRLGRAHAEFSRLQGHKTAVVKLAELDDEPTGLDGLDAPGAVANDSEPRSQQDRALTAADHGLSLDSDSPRARRAVSVTTLSGCCVMTSSRRAISIRHFEENVCPEKSPS